MTRAKGPLLTFLVVGGLVAAAVAGEGVVFSATFGGVVGLVAAVIWFRFAPAVREGYETAGDVALDRRRLLRNLAERGEPVGVLGDLRVFSSPPSFVAIPPDPAATEVLSWLITGEVQAGVEAVGAVSVTRGRNLRAIRHDLGLKVNPLTARELAEQMPQVGPVCRAFGRPEFRQSLLGQSKGHPKRRVHSQVGSVPLDRMC